MEKTSCLIHLMIAGFVAITGCSEAGSGLGLVDDRDGGNPRTELDGRVPDDQNKDASLPDDGKVSVAYTLCNGSDEIRLSVVSNGGGPLEATFDYTNPYGHSFLFVTGRCDYLVGGNLTKGLRQGSLTQQQAERIEIDLHLAELPGFSEHSDEGCPDADVQYLRTANGYGECSCGCDDDAPAHLEDAKKSAFALKDQLLESATTIERPIEMLVIESENGSPIDPLQWPYQFGAQDLAISIEELYKTPYEVDPTILTGEDADCARELRDTVFGSPSYDYLDFVPVNTDDGQSYKLYLIDQIPTQWSDAITAFGEPYWG